MISSICINLPNIREKIDFDLVSKAANKGCLITSIALTTLGSAALAYYAPTNYWLTAAAVILINMHTLPAAIQSGRSSLVKAALITIFISSNSLVLGQLGVKMVDLIYSMFTSLMIDHNVREFLEAAFWFTFTSGCLLPACLSSLKKLLPALNKVEWEEGLNQLKNDIHVAASSISSPLLQLRGKALACLYLLTPNELGEAILHFLSICHVHSRLGFLIHNYFSNPHFQNPLQSLETYFNDTYAFRNGEAMFEDEQEIFYLSLQSRLNSFPSNYSEQVINLLLDQAKWMVPNCISAQQFIELFQNHPDFLENITTRINAFNQNTPDQLGQFRQDISQIQIQLQTLEEGLGQISVEKWNDSEKKEAFENCKNLFIQIKKDLKSTIREKSLIDTYHQLLIDSEIPSELEFISSQDLTNLKLINKSFSTIEIIFERLNTKFNLSEEKEKVDSITFLGDNRCEFKLKDYEDLLHILKLSDISELEDKLNEIGLGTEEDLYENNILPRATMALERKNITKEEIKLNFEIYIQKTDVIAKKSTSPDSSEENSLINRLKPLSASFNPSNIKLPAIIYKVALKGLVLVPILLQPVVGLTGVGLGAIYFSGKHLRVFQGGPECLQNVYPIVTVFMSGLNYLVQRRNFFSSPSESIQEDINLFKRSSIPVQLRLLSKEIFCTLLIISRSMLPYIGAFLQGAHLSRELVNCLTSSDPEDFL